MVKYVLSMICMLFILSGCAAQSNEDSMNRLLVSGTEQDENFLYAARAILASASETMLELELELQELQTEDELHEAQERMERAREDILFQWNRLRNDLRPRSEQMQAIKQELEDLLSDYREGLALELAGMNAGDPTMMKKGYEQTERAKKAVLQFEL